MKTYKEFTLSILFDFWFLIAPVIIGVIGTLFLYDYFTWEQYAYPPHTYWGLGAGIFASIIAIITSWSAGMVLSYKYWRHSKK